MPMGEELLDTYRLAADIVRDEKTRPPEACPYDGTPLDAGPEGQLHCPWDGYEFPRDGRLI